MRERKRAGIAAALAVAPATSDRAIGRQLGVDRETVAAVRAETRTATRASASKIDRRARRSGGRTLRDGYSSVRAQAAASAVLEAVRAARPKMTRGDRRRLLKEMGAEMEA